MNHDEQQLLEEKYGGKETTEYEKDKERLARGEPLGYVISWQPFLGLKIYLDSKPLIPRPETEWWTEQLLNGCARDLPLSFLDLCAGSGAIGYAALAHLPNAHVYFSEIDPIHKCTIHKNMHENHLDESRATIGIGDLFAPFGDMTFDVIAANPPYIPVGRRLPDSVAGFEPLDALVAGEDGLDIIRRIAEELPRRLNKSGTAWIECDSGHAAAAAACFTDQGLRAEIRNDQYDMPRIIVVSFL